MEADPNSFLCYLPVSLYRSWGAEVGKGTLSRGELVMLHGLQIETNFHLGRIFYVGTWIYFL